MKLQLNSLKTTMLLSATVMAVGFTAGCGAKFEAGPSNLDLRPPVTADPLSAEDQRRLNATQEHQTSTPQALEGDVERGAVIEDMTEGKPNYTDAELAEAAERLFSKRQSPQRPAPTAQPVTAPTVDSRTKPAGPVAQRPSPQRPTADIHSRFCERLNVISDTVKADLSLLYNSKAKLPATMPSAELAGAATSQDKKNHFICNLLPSAIRMNEEVFKQRVEILRLQAKKAKGPLTSEDDQWLNDMRTAYGVKDSSDFAELLKRVDIVPLPLLLAQAAIESGWGTSRATNDLKNLFGLHASSGQPCKTGYDTNNACVRVFDSFPRSVSAYIQLLNTGSFYPKFRDLRAKMRQAGEALDSLRLLAALGSYNETPLQYIRNVRDIMTGSNKLTQFSFEESSVKAEN